jgi:hypothetical protein
MTDIRFAVGQSVRLRRAYSHQPQDSYVVAGVMPFDGQTVQYRIKSPHEQFFRVVKEFELAEDNSAGALFK